MDEKQIIIDNCDVSGCNFLLKREDKILCECCHATGFGVICECEKWKTCYYKQLKRAEQKLAKIEKVCNKFIPDHYKILLIINDGIVEE